eukprot:gb/GFBE01014272.1/.p1 GENE.gb/GFBE01014272.1/~~gb/GFBE01014272.1/.p1  ORF type:complete len:174 (+),score=25.20 gb/GFBE01014272.1/:1-522(+)
MACIRPFILTMLAQAGLASSISHHAGSGQGRFHEASVDADAGVQVEQLESPDQETLDPVLQCKGTFISTCPEKNEGQDRQDPCNQDAAGSCVNVYHVCEGEYKQCRKDSKNNQCYGEKCYLPCTGALLEGATCGAQSTDRCNNGYVSDGASGMTCRISPSDITKCVSDKVCAP